MATKYFISGGPGELDLLIALGRQEEVFFTLGLIDKKTGYEEDGKGGRFLAEASITALRAIQAHVPPEMLDDERITRRHTRVIDWQIKGTVKLNQERELFKASYNMINRAGTMEIEK